MPDADMQNPTNCWRLPGTVSVMALRLVGGFNACSLGLGGHDAVSTAKRDGTKRCQFVLHVCCFLRECVCVETVKFETRKPADPYLEATEDDDARNETNKQQPRRTTNNKSKQLKSNGKQFKATKSNLKSNEKRQKAKKPLHVWSPNYSDPAKHGHAHANGD